jgi:hypothetical protein
MSTYEWVALCGLVFAGFLLLPRLRSAGADRWNPPRLFLIASDESFPRFLAIYALVTFVAYSAIGYKTPWCLMAMIWPLFLLFGMGVDRAMARIDGWVFGSISTLIGAFSLVTRMASELPRICRRERTLRLRADLA